PLMRALLAVLACCCMALLPLRAQTPAPFGPPPDPAAAAGIQTPSNTPPAKPVAGPGLTLTFGGGDERQNLGSAIQIVLLVPALSMAPAIVMTMTCFTRIVVVLSFLKRAMSMQDLPPAIVTTGFALFMTIFVMRPVAVDVYDSAWVPYSEQRIGWREAA